MIIFSALAGFFAVLLINALAETSAKRIIEFCMHSAKAFGVYAFLATLIVFCSLVFYAGGVRLAWGVPYQVGKFLSMPVIGMSILALVAGAWIAVERPAVVAFFKRLVAPPKENPGEGAGK